MRRDLRDRLLRLIFWSPRRFAAAFVIALVVLGVMFRAATAVRGHHATARAPAPAASSPQPASPSPSPAASSPAAASSTPAAATSPAAPSGTAPPAGRLPLQAGEDFAAAWMTRGAHWLQEIRPDITAGLAARLAAGPQARPPATSITGAPRITRPGTTTAVITVPTNAGPLQVTVVRSGGRWLASAIGLARPGAGPGSGKAR
jgi:hypothetical protein